VSGGPSRNFGPPLMGNPIENKREVTFTIALGDKTLTGKGESVFDALTKIKRPEKILTKATVTIDDGVKKTTQLFWPVRLKRLFYNATFQKLQAKQLERAMK